MDRRAIMGRTFWLPISTELNGWPKQGIRSVSTFTRRRCRRGQFDLFVDENGIRLQRPPACVWDLPILRRLCSVVRRPRDSMNERASVRCSGLL